MRIILNEMRTTLFPLVWISVRSTERRVSIGTDNFFFFSRVCVPPPRPETRRPTTGDRPSRHRSTAGERAGVIDDDASSGGTIDVCARRAQVWRSDCKSTY